MSGSPEEDDPPFRDEAVPCGACGDPESGSATWGGCRNHPEYAYCHDGTLFPLLRGKTFDPGFPARGPSHSSGGEPGEPARVLCPTCNNEALSETACTSEGCPFEAWPFERVVDEAFRPFRAVVQRSFRLFVKGEMDAVSFRRDVVAYARVSPHVILNSQGNVVFETKEAVMDRKRLERRTRRDTSVSQKRWGWHDEHAAETLEGHLALAGAA